MFIGFRVRIDATGDILPLGSEKACEALGTVGVIIAIALARGSLWIRPLWLVLLVACALGVAMEVLDMRDDLNSLDAWRWQESTLDFLRTIAVPLAALLLVFAIKRKRRQ